MPIIPDFALAVFKVYLTQLLVWLSDQTYLTLLQQDPDHLLVKLVDHLKLAPLETACTPYHHTAGPGTPPSHPVPRLVRALVVKYLYDWSLRDLEWHIRFNLVVKWFVGYPIFAVGPDHSTLERFELWVCFKQHRTVFDEILHQIDTAFPEERQQSQVGDTYALRANAAKETLVDLLRHTCQRVLATLRKLDAARETAVRAELDLGALFGAKDERSEFHLTAAERTARLQTTVRAALDCARRVRAYLETPTPLTAEHRTPLLEWLSYLDKIIADEVAVVPTDNPSAPQVTERPADDKGAYRLGSATDPEATYRVHGDDGAKTDFGYNVQVAVTENFVREVHMDTAAPNPMRSRFQRCCAPKRNTTTWSPRNSSMIRRRAAARRVPWLLLPRRGKRNSSRPCSRLTPPRANSPLTASSCRTMRPRCAVPTNKPRLWPIAPAVATDASFGSWVCNVATVQSGTRAARRNLGRDGCAKSSSVITAVKSNARNATTRPRHFNSICSNDRGWNGLSPHSCGTTARGWHGGAASSSATFKPR
jgi:hypothetical protein